ncbi:hypothetical protein AMS68_004681 [Peltaster fructicola]|uniref:Carrier domain-containing protein n=1 Tax=Peltaster fructicola TaxID=286661 RepID=A0A6H0XWR5_9PEZI|nr:hypothetical protein AMS68_004681 [Peltaster fructicola]
MAISSSPTCGRRTLLSTIDALARTSGSVIWAQYAASTSAFEKGEFRSVSFATLANAIARLADHLAAIQASLQTSAKTSLCYIGPSDIRYFLLACAASKLHLEILFSSPRNDLRAHISLLEQTACHILLGPEDDLRNSIYSSIAAERQMSIRGIPSLTDLLDAPPARTLRGTKDFDDCSDETFVILHTTGSTGQPKPVRITHGLISTIDAQQKLAEVDGRHVTAQRWANLPVYTALPPFHSAGINFFAYSIFQATELIFGPPDVPPSTASINRMLSLNKTQAAVLPPSLLEQAASDKAMLPRFTQWSSVIYGGGPLSAMAGDALWQYTQVLHILGSTETFNIPELEPRSIDEWRYHHFHPALNISFRPQENGLHELVFVRKEMRRASIKAPLDFPGGDRVLHARLARLDDVIVLSNGEKFNPKVAESIIATEPLVASALIVGAGHEQSAVLVELAKDAVDVARPQLQKVIEGRVELANTVLPAHAQLHESHVCVLDSNVTFLRSAKGDVRRGPTVDALEHVINNVYVSAEHTIHSGHPSVDTSTVDSLSSSLLQVAQKELPSKIAGGFGVQDDLFVKAGLDSLQVVKMARSITRCMRQQGQDVDLAPRTIYEHPSMHGISEVLLSTSRQPSPTLDDGLDKMESLLAACKKHIDMLKRSIVPSKEAGGDAQVVILTGSAGSLGSYVLDSLIRQDTVRKVFCLNRQGSDEERQRRAHDSRGLSQDLAKVIFLQTNMLEARLGLESDVYDSLRDEATHIIHNAWPVDFNLALNAFEPHLKGCCQLIELAVAAKHHVSTVFLSSIGAANNWNVVYPGLVPEAQIDDLRVAEPMGYAQSKLVAELTFAYAGHSLQESMTVCRIGQITGPVKQSKGIWNTKEWFPSIMLTSQKLGKIPSSLAALDCMDWYPVDYLADVILETCIINAPRSELTSYMHFVNPNKSYWSAVVESLVANSKTEVVTYTEWLSALTAAVDSADAETANLELPAMMLLPFLEAIGQPDHQRPTFDTTRTCESSRVLEQLGPVTVSWVRHWLNQWQVQF